MNINQAKQIPLQKLVEYLGGRFARAGRSGETWWYSPFRPDERTASFKIDEKTNQWHDFARTAKVDAHGDIVDLWTDFHNLPRRNGEAIKSALQALQSFNNAPITSKPYHAKPAQSAKDKAIGGNSARYKLLKPPTRIRLDSLRQEIARRGLTIATVNDHLKQIVLLDTKTRKTYNGFAFQNDKGGYEISIPNPNRGASFKTSIAPKGITTFYSASYSIVQVYEGFWDFYTWVQMNKCLGQINHIVLNSTSNVKEATDFITERKQSIQSVLSFMDNDPAGEKATNYLAEMLNEQNIRFGTKNHIYEGYKDLNEWWTDAPDARNNIRL